MQTLREIAVPTVPGTTEAVDVLEQIAGLQYTVELLESDITQLEQALLEPGWLRLTATGEQEFTRTGLAMIARLCRLMRIKNPLLRRASAIKVYYVFGQGVTISAADDHIADVVTELVDDSGNQATIFGQSAQAECETALHTDANLFLACFTHPRTGRVQVRDIPFDEINEVISNPDDRAEPWFYLREWTRVARDGNMLFPTTRSAKALYPAIDHQPKQQPPQVGGLDVRWDSPVLHVHTNRPRNWMFGVPELYPALDWARAHAEFLDDFRRLVKVLAKLAWALTGVKGSQLERAKTAMAAATAADAPVGQAFVGDVGGGKLEPLMRGGGVQVEPGDARQFALMVAAATDIPETMLLGDPSTGNLATATTLDRPTELAMEWRRRLWAGVYQRLCQYALDQAVLAPQGLLRGVREYDEFGRQQITLAGDTPRTINVDWPPIQERTMGDVIKALVGSTSGANAVEGMPPEVILRTALVALDVDDPDEVVAKAMASLGTPAEERTDRDDAVVEALAELREAISGLPEAA